MFRPLANLMNNYFIGVKLSRNKISYFSPKSTKKINLRFVDFSSHFLKSLDRFTLASNAMTWNTEYYCDNIVIRFDKFIYFIS